MKDKEEYNQEEAGIGYALFTQLVLSFQAAAWQQMGKVKSIVTGELERNLEMAKHSIDMLGMLEEKTKGNLTDDESRYLQHVLFELRMNYLDEVKKGPDKKDESAAGTSEAGPDESAPDEQDEKTD